jgi:hypothetical protein
MLFFLVVARFLFYVRAQSRSNSADLAFERDAFGEAGRFFELNL